MSKIVRGIGRAVSRVAKGVVNVARKVVRSPIGRVLATAAAVYFGGAALMGAMGSGAAATAGATGGAATGLSGAAANISAAWSSLGTAGSALMSGNVSGATNALASGFSGNAAGAAATALAPTAPLSLEAQVAALPPVTGGAAPAASKGIISSMMSSPYAAPAMISAGSQLVGGVMQGYGQQQALREQRQYERDLSAEQRARYNENMGTSLWGSAPTGPQQRSSLPPVAAPPAQPALPPVARAGIINRFTQSVDPATGMPYDARFA